MQSTGHIVITERTRIGVHRMRIAPTLSLNHLRQVDILMMAPGRLIPMRGSTI